MPGLEKEIKKMETLTSEELLDNLEFSVEIDGIIESVRVGHEFFEPTKDSWLDLRVRTEEDRTDGKILLQPEDSDSFLMEKSEYLTLLG